MGRLKGKKKKTAVSPKYLLIDFAAFFSHAKDLKVLRVGSKAF